MFRRVSKTIARIDRIYDSKINLERIEQKFFDLMTQMEFLPNSPTLMNSNTTLNQLSACFVLPVNDSLISIFETLKNTALIQQSGGGVGFSFSRLRPKGDIVKSTSGVSSGPLSFMKIYDLTSEVIKQGGRRRGANIAILNVIHPDIEKFIKVKAEEGKLENFNLSVAVNDEFMQILKQNGSYHLINPRNQEKVAKIRAEHIFNLIVKNAWKSGDPGIVFLDEINRYNPTPKLGRIESTNPCGEQPLLPYESCNLGSINLEKMVQNGKLNWEKLEITVKSAVHFLDNVIDANKYSLAAVKHMTLMNRKIGLGVMGFAEMLIMLGIPYNSHKALHMAENVMEFISKCARESSIYLGEERGSFPNFKESKWFDEGYSSMRNATTTTIAPTGTISIIANVTSGIEPIFAVSYLREVMDGTTLLETNHLFQEKAKEEGFFQEDLMLKIARGGSIKNISEIPEYIQQLFICAHDVEPEWHVKIQAAFQKYTDNAVAKTVNLPPNATVDQVKKIFLLAYQLKCKGITVYRYGSKKKQVLKLDNISKKDKESEYLVVKSDYSGGCPSINCPH